MASTGPDSACHTEGAFEPVSPSSLPDGTIPSDRDTPSSNDELTGRNSAFLEIGLGGNDAIVDEKLRREARPKLQVRFQSKVDIVEPGPSHVLTDPVHVDKSPRPQVPLLSSTPFKLIFLALVALLVVPGWRTSPILRVDANPVGAGAGPASDIGRAHREKREPLPPHVKRDDSPTVVCKRWSQQSALVNGTLYLYGGRLTTSSDQTTDEWSELPEPNLISSADYCASRQRLPHA
jgi:hypothetical protein